MAPTRRQRRPSVHQLAYPPTPPSADDDDYTPENPGDSSYYYGPASSKSSSLQHYHQSQQQRAHSSSMSGATPLQRGSACLSCRKRKMKCDGSRPICQQCNRANRAADCEYDDGKTKTRTQVLQEKIHRLEARIRQLESPQGGTSSTSKDQGLNPLQQMADIAFEQGSSTLLPEQRSSTFTPHQTSFDFNVVVDPQSRSDLAFDFGATASTSATLGYDQLQLRQVIDAASGTSSTAEQAWDGMDISTIPTDALGTTSDWHQDEMPARARQNLLDIVLPHLPHLGVDIHPQALLQSLNLPPTHGMRPHPSILNALYLHACALTPPDHYLHSHQARFLKRTRDAIAASLEFNDRIIDTLRAQCLLATWYLKMGRTLEGYYVICSMARFAVGCELNRIVSPVWKLVDGNNPSDPNSSLNVSKDLRRVTTHVGLGVGLPSLAATAAAASSSTTNGPLLDREGNVDVFQSIMSSNLTNPRKISLGFGTGMLPPSSFANTTQSLRADPGSAMAMSSSSPYHMAAAAANGRRLNESSGGSMVKVNPVLDAPRSSKELGERILLFWRIFNMDRFWSVVCGLQPALSEDEVLTVWPRSMEDYEMGNVNDKEYSSIRSLGVPPRSSSDASVMRPDSVPTLLSKSIALFERSARLAGSLSPVQPPTEAFWHAFRLMESSIAQMTATLEPYKRRSTTTAGTTMDMMGTGNGGSGSISQAGSHRPSPSGSVQGESPTTTNPAFHSIPQYAFVQPRSTTHSPLAHATTFPTSMGRIEIDSTLVLVHILLRASAVQLHNIFAMENSNDYQKAFTAARAGAAIVAEVAEVMQDTSENDIMLGPCLTLIADVLIREALRGEIYHSNHSGNGANNGGVVNSGGSLIESIEPELEAVLFMLRSIGAKSPLVQRQAALVSAAKDAAFAQVHGQHGHGQVHGQVHAHQQQPQQATMGHIPVVSMGMTVPHPAIISFGS